MLAFVLGFLNSVIQILPNLEANQSHRHHREEDGRWSFDDAIQRRRCTQCNGHRHCRSNSVDATKLVVQSKLVQRGDFGGLKSDAESQRAESPPDCKGEGPWMSETGAAVVSLSASHRVEHSLELAQLATALLPHSTRKTAKSARRGRGETTQQGEAGRGRGGAGDTLQQPKGRGEGGNPTKMGGETAQPRRGRETASQERGRDTLQPKRGRETASKKVRAPQPTKRKKKEKNIEKH